MAQTTAADPLVVTGSSSESFAAATDDAIRKAARTIRGIRGAHVLALDAVVQDESVVEYVATVGLSLAGL